MTTIAYRNGVLAADRAVTKEIRLPVVKIGRSTAKLRLPTAGIVCMAPPYLYAMAGSGGTYGAVAAYMSGYRQANRHLQKLTEHPLVEMMSAGYGDNEDHTSELFIVGYRALAEPPLVGVLQQAFPDAAATTEQALVTSEPVAVLIDRNGVMLLEPDDKLGLAFAGGSGSAAAMGAMYAGASAAAAVEIASKVDPYTGCGVKTVSLAGDDPPKYPYRRDGVVYYAGNAANDSEARGRFDAPR